MRLLVLRLVLLMFVAKVGDAVELGQRLQLAKPGDGVHRAVVWLVVPLATGVPVILLLLVSPVALLLLLLLLLLLVLPRLLLLVLLPLPLLKLPPALPLLLLLRRTELLLLLLRRRLSSLRLGSHCASHPRRLRRPLTRRDAFREPLKHRWRRRPARLHGQPCRPPLAHTELVS